MNGPQAGLKAIVQDAAKNKYWSNYHQTVKQKVARQVVVWNAVPQTPSIPAYNATTAALQSLIGQAEQNDQRLRAMGGQWSFSSVAATDGILIDTRGLNYRFWPTDTDVHPSRQGRAQCLVFAQCGVMIGDLNRALLALGKSLRTSGASNGQTIAGAIGTGTHGSAIDQGAIHDSVVAMHLIVGSNRHVWVERKSAPVMSKDFIDALGAEFVSDDDVFDAALVSFGSFGLVHGVVLEVDDLFWLEAYRSQCPKDVDPWPAIETLDFTNLKSRPGVRPYFFSAVFNPYDRAGGPYLTAIYRDPQNQGGPRPEHSNKHPGDGAAELVALLADLPGGVPRPIQSVLLKLMYPDQKGVCGTWGEMFWDTDSHGLLTGMGIGIPLAHVREAVEALYDLNTQIKLPGVFAVRYVRPTRAVLGFTRHHDMTCVVDIDGAASKATTNFGQAAWDRFVGLGIPVTYHWGKMPPTKPLSVARMYGPTALAKWLAARKRLLATPTLREVFTNAYMKDRKLDL